MVVHFLGDAGRICAGDGGADPGGHIAARQGNCAPRNSSRRGGGAAPVSPRAGVRRTAVIKGDTSVLEKYLSDDYVAIAPNGQEMDKTRSIQDLKNGTVKYSAIDVTDDRVRMYGDTAIYTGHANVRMTVNGQPQPGEVRATIVWAKQNGQWKRASFQATFVQTPNAAR